MVPCHPSVARRQVDELGVLVKESHVTINDNSEGPGLFDEAEGDTPQRASERLELPDAKLIDLPRLTAWYGDEGKGYTYSGITVNPDPWTPTLLGIKKEIE